GIFDGMTYEEVLEKYPDEHEQRYQDKFKYRSPRGEVREVLLFCLIVAS
ncbi:6-phosphofructo-2-kinase fructose-2,6-bisphosphatase isoform X1, partial [Paramuricea clavata]